MLLALGELIISSLYSHSGHGLVLAIWDTAGLVVGAAAILVGTDMLSSSVLTAGEVVDWIL